MKNFMFGLGLLGATSLPLSLDLNAQNSYIARTGIACNITKLENSYHLSPGFESIIERELNGMERLSGELLLGFYADLPFKTKNYYSKMQANLGLKYYPVLNNNGWYIGAKGALGISSEFYKSPNHPMGEERHLTKSLTLDVEKMFNKKNALNLSLSRELDRKSWIISGKWVLRPNFGRQYYH